jgi:hypothetical protein
VKLSQVKYLSKGIWFEKKPFRLGRFFFAYSARLQPCAIGDIKSYTARQIYKAIVKNCLVQGRSLTLAMMLKKIKKAQGRSLAP